MGTLINGKTPVEHLEERRRALAARTADYFVCKSMGSELKTLEALPEMIRPQFIPWLLGRSITSNLRGAFVSTYRDRYNSGFKEDVGPNGEDQLPPEACPEAHEALAMLVAEWRWTVLKPLYRMSVGYANSAKREAAGE